MEYNKIGDSYSDVAEVQVFWDAKLLSPDTDTSWKTRILGSSTAMVSRSHQAQSSY